MRESKNFQTRPEKTDPRRSAWSFVNFEDCKKGQTAAKTGCTPASGEGGKKEGEGSYEGYRSLEKKLKEAQKAQGNLNDAWVKLDENDFESIEVPGFGRMSKEEVEKKAEEYDQLVDETFEKRDEFRDSLSPEDRDRVGEEDNKQEKAEEAEEDLLEEGRKLPIPRSLESLKNHPWVDEVSDERDDGDGVWVYLKNSLWNDSDDTSFVNGENIRDVLRHWRDMKVIGRSKREE
tara:strand:- start:4358 stop:5056 length:699 start_codon:yes stop_codon:yes gene_type:complete